MDKMMQAAGWLRLLGCGQKLRLTATEDVTRRIDDQNRLSGGEPGAKEILQWVMHNTTQDTQHGITEWARQGSFFAASKGRPDRAIQKEVLELGDMYQAGSEKKAVASVVQQIVNGPLSHAELAKGMPEMLREIRLLGCRHGQGHWVVSGPGRDEECEREVEQDEEEEDERERQLPRMEAAPERDWAYDDALDASSPWPCPRRLGSTHCRPWSMACSP